VIERHDVEQAIRGRELRALDDAHCVAEKVFVGEQDAFRQARAARRELHHREIGRGEVDLGDTP
jgi:hypothetical protein